MAEHLRFCFKKMNAKFQVAYFFVLCAVYVQGCDHRGCDDIVMVSRAEWKARTSKENDTMEETPPNIFIHHTAGPECSDLDSCSKVMRGIQNFHMDDRGWDDIGYSFLIGGDGRVYEGRGWTRVGAHTYGFNKVSIGFSLMGNFMEKEPSQIMLQTTKSLIGCAQLQSYVTCDYKIHGHRDGFCTECPGDAFYKVITHWPRFEGGPLKGYQCKKLDK